ncbi:SDR family oxidoreductase [Ornithinimicrobium sp. W1679]|uniref:SDR family oxidoreductase n=1 Tax=Ornithinimicrobium sp. W1679 TaxID=3418770 RepID=UPI003CF96118
MFLVCGATGDLGGRVVRRLVADGRQVRVLVRPTSDAGALEALGVEVVPGDLRDPASLVPAMAGVHTVVSTANTLARILAGDKGLSVRDVDVEGNQHLVRAAEEAGVRRFVYLSAAGFDQGAGARAPFVAAKRATERALRQTSMETVLVRPDMFQEVWLSPTGGIDPQKGRATIYGKGNAAHRYVAVDDVAALVAHLAVADTVPPEVEFGGPEAITPNEAVAAFERATGRSFTVRHVPRPVLAVASRLLARPRPALASVMGMSLHSDTHPSTCDDRPLREAGIEPRSVTAYVEETAASTV